MDMDVLGFGKHMYCVNRLGTIPEHVTQSNLFVQLQSERAREGAISTACCATLNDLPKDVIFQALLCFRNSPRGKFEKLSKLKYVFFSVQ